MMPNSQDEQRPADADAWLEVTEVQISESARTLSLRWGDGHKSTYAWWYLRGLCPCAVCQGHGNDFAFVPEGADSDLGEVFEVGHYALNLTWRDGHRTGIYSFRTLRLLCPCAACRDAVGEAHAARLPPVAARLAEAGG